MDITDLMYKKQMIKNKLKGYIKNKKKLCKLFEFNIKDAEELINLHNMNIDELTKLLKIIKLMIENYNTIEDIINFKDCYY